ncbi:hypothetical protein [Marinibacterium sp. SX1]|uniref:hypothetical protein n=1 Tax=Marinibacterium sp. SX1 TaxID=3388424 RepID=UPI003D1765C6
MLPVPRMFRARNVSRGLDGIRPCQPIMRPMMTFDFAMSFGKNCAARRQLDYKLAATLPPDAPEEMVRATQSESFLFDWLITPEQALLRLLRSDFDGFCRQENIVLKNRPSGQMVLEKNYRTQHPHAFGKRGKDHLSTEDISEQFAAYKAKIDYLIAKTRRALSSDAPKLFVLHGSQPGEHVDKLVRVLARKTTNFHLRQVEAIHPGGSPTPRPADSARVSYRTVPYLPYPGSTPHWQQALSDLDIRNRFAPRTEDDPGAARQPNSRRAVE